MRQPLLLSLVPKNEDGTYVHGALKEFAARIGRKTGNVVSDWIAGRSKSYQKYVYGVAVEWLTGGVPDGRAVCGRGWLLPGNVGKA